MYIHPKLHLPVFSASLQHVDSFQIPDVVIRVFVILPRLELSANLISTLSVSASKSQIKNVKQGSIKGPQTLLQDLSQLSDFVQLLALGMTMKLVALNTVFYNTFSRTGQLNIPQGTETHYKNTLTTCFTLTTSGNLYFSLFSFNKFKETKWIFFFKARNINNFPIWGRKCQKTMQTFTKNIFPRLQTLNLIQKTASVLQP